MTGTLPYYKACLLISMLGQMALNVKLKSINSFFCGVFQVAESSVMALFVDLLGL